MKKNNETTHFPHVKTKLASRKFSNVFLHRKRRREWVEKTNIKLRSCRNLNTGRISLKNTSSPCSPTCWLSPFVKITFWIPFVEQENSKCHIQDVCNRINRKSKVAFDENTRQQKKKYAKQYFWWFISLRIRIGE